jgi:hypothetical protein
VRVVSCLTPHSVENLRPGWSHGAQAQQRKRCGRRQLPRHTFCPRFVRLPPPPPNCPFKRFFLCLTRGDDLSGSHCCPRGDRCRGSSAR